MQKVSRYCMKLIFCTHARKRIVSVTKPTGVYDFHVAEGLPKPCGVLPQLPFDIIDNDGMRPREELCFSKEPFASPGGGYNEDIAQFRALLGWGNSQDFS